MQRRSTSRWIDTVRRRRLALVCAALCCAGIAAFAVWTSIKPALSPELTAQSGYSTKCKTPAGLCYVSAARIGSSCYCSKIKENGTIVP